MQDPLARVDLNLLIAFQVLMQEKNVTRAAERLFVTQPAMSKTLNRLRLALNDDLFVRSPHGLIPTQKALELEQPMNDIINQLTELMISKAEFDPASSEATISIATLGTSASIGVPSFINKIQKEAPNILFLFQNLDAEYEQRLRSGSLDFAIVAKSRFNKELISHKLMNIKPVLYMRRNHPLASKKTPSLAERQKYPHMALYFPNFESSKEDIEKLFASFGIESKIPLLTSNMLIALESLKASDMLMIASDRLIASSIINEHFVCRPLPEAINLKIDSLSLVQHIRTKNSALHNFLIKQMVEGFSESDDDCITCDS